MSNKIIKNKNEYITIILGYVPGAESSSSYGNVRISTQSPFKNIPATVLIPGQWYSANIEPLSFWRARLTVHQSSQHYEMNLTFVGSTSGMATAEKVIWNKIRYYKCLFL